MPCDKKCCVPGCTDTETGASRPVLHGFPNPVKDLKRFNVWRSSIGGPILDLSNEHIYKYRRVCHDHFEETYRCRYERLSKVAVPTLKLAAQLSIICN
ncbi:hypothetical protein evm_012706 [Chilo suppressalis]|nr:hypothetical protein evm_012706 [Chilo suppressalis]